MGLYHKTKISLGKNNKNYLCKLTNVTWPINCAFQYNWAYMTKPKLIQIKKPKKGKKKKKNLSLLINLFFELEMSLHKMAHIDFH